MGRLSRILCLDDFEPAARAHLPRQLFGYVSGAAETNHSLRDNREAFAEYAFPARVLVDVSKRSTRATVLGEDYAAPFGIAPMGIHALTTWRGDVTVARAAQDADIPMILSGSSLIPLEDVVRANPRAWFQAYLPGQPDQIDALVERVARAGFRTLVVTVDVPVSANRENNVRNGFSIPLRPSPRLAWDGVSHPRWLFGTFLRTLAQHGMPHFENQYAHRGAPILSRNVLRDYSDRGHFTWAHYRRIRAQWKGKLVLKGILHPDDARRAGDEGSDALIVSNHGGRQLDGALSPLRALPDVVAAVPGLPVMLDSGIRRGTDILKAMALGACFTFVGRPFNYASSVAGHAGVLHAAKLLREEVSRDMAMLGICALPELDAAVHLRRIR